jgi:hypothetical protein
VGYLEDTVAELNEVNQKCALSMRSLDSENVGQAKAEPDFSEQQPAVAPMQPQEQAQEQQRQQQMLQLPQPQQPQAASCSPRLPSEEASTAQPPPLQQPLESAAGLGLVVQVP